MTMNEKLERLQNLQSQILAIANTGNVTAVRVMYCTAERFSLEEVTQTIIYLHQVGILTQNPALGK